MSQFQNYNPVFQQTQNQQQQQQQQQLGIGMQGALPPHYAQPNMRTMGVGRGVGMQGTTQAVLGGRLPGGQPPQQNATRLMSTPNAGHPLLTSSGGPHNGHAYVTAQQDLLAMLNRPQGNAYNPQPRASSSPGSAMNSNLTNSAGGNANVLTNSAGLASSPSTGGNDLAFDMSSFPALAPSGGNNNDSNHQSQQELNLAGEDFPALGGGPSKPSKNSPSQRRRGNNTAIVTPDQFPQLSRSQPSNLSSSPKQSAASQPNSSSSGAQRSPDDARGDGKAGTDDAANRYSLLGLLSVIRMADADRNTLALGTDLTTLGLNLNSSDNLYSTFTSPFAERQATRPPDFYLPACYYMQPPMQPAHTKIANFSDEILFYIFYSMPNDKMQLFAAAELYGREWRFHMEHKLWFIRNGSDHTVQNGTEKGNYFFFDVTSWEKVKKDNFVLEHDKLEPKPDLKQTPPAATTK